MNVIELRKNCVCQLNLSTQMFSYIGCNVSTCGCLFLSILTAIQQLLQHLTFNLPHSFTATTASALPLLALLSSVHECCHEYLACINMHTCVFVFQGIDQTRGVETQSPRPELHDVYLPNPSPLEKDGLPHVTRCGHLGNSSRGELPTGRADLCLLCPTEDAHGCSITPKC